MSQTDFDMLPEGSRRHIRPALVVTAGFSMFITTEGLAGLANLGTDSLHDVMKIVLLGGTLWVVFYLLWDLCLGIIPKAGRMTLFAIAMMLCMVVPTVFAASTMFGAAGLAGIAPIQFHLTTGIRLFDEMKFRLVSSINRLYALRPIVKASADHYGREAEKELATGHYTGEPGPGAVSSTLLAIESELNAVAASIHRISSNAPAIDAALTQHIANMREIMDRDIPIRARERLVADEANKARSLMARLDISGTMSAIRQALASLEKSAADQAVSSRSAKLAAAQRKALEQLAAEMRKTAEKLTAFLDEIDDGEDAVLPAITHITPTTGVLMYWREFLPIWATAIAIDFAVIVVISFLTLAEVKKRRLEAKPVDIREMRFGDLLLTREAISELRDFALVLDPPKRGPGRPRKSDANPK